MPQSPNTAKDIFLAPLDTVPEKRAELLDDACASDADLRCHVEALLRVHDEPDSLLDSPHIDLGTSDAALAVPNLRRPLPEKPGDTIGSYKLLQHIGEGGMGVVYMAKQTKPVKRRVALKIVKPGMDTRQVIARFEAERQALALMDHPHIAKVYDAGTTDSGRPYFVMELVRGIPITEFCDQHQLTVRERLELFVTVCQAAQHAHQKGIIHRDIKPSNVLVTLHDDRPVVKVIDFGVAKATSGQLTDKTLFTGFLQMLGTPMYMSPEQTALSGADVDTRSDIYSLGVLLYELLTGTTPFDRERLEKVAVDEVRRIIREEEPKKPSTRLTTLQDSLPTLAALRRIEPRKLSQLLRGDLDWIVMKALEKDRTRRYETASSFARDVQRYLTDEVVEARPPSTGYRLRKVIRRNKMALTTLALVVLSLVVGTVVGTWQAVRATQAQRHAQEQTELATQRAQEASHARDRADADRQRAQQRELEAWRSRYQTHMMMAQQAWVESDIPRVLAQLNFARPKPGQPDLRTVGWHYLWRQCHSERMTYRGHSAPLWDATFSPDGESLATASADHTVKVWDVATGRKQFSLVGHEHEVNAVIYSPDGTLLATASDDETARLWDAATGRPRGRLDGHRGHVRAIAFDAESKLLATAGSDTIIKLWDVESRKQRGQFRGHTGEINQVAFSPDGQVLASCADDGTVRLWDVSTQQQRAKLSGHTGHVRSVAFSPITGLLASSGQDTQIKLWNVQTLEEIASLSGHTGPVTSVAFSADGKLLVSASYDRTAIIWNLANHQVLRTVKGHGRNVYTVAISPDGRWLVTGSADTTAKLWDMPRPERVILAGHKQPAYTVAFSPDGNTLASGGWDRQIRLWDVATGRERAAFAGLQGVLLAVAFFADGNTLASAGTNGTIKLWNVATHDVRLELSGCSEAIQQLAFSPDGRQLACGSDDATVRIWDVSTGKEVATLTGHTAPVDCVHFFPDGRRLASSSRDQTVRIWDTVRQRELAVYSGHKGIIRALAVSPDGKTVAAGVVDGVIYLWDVATGQVRSTLRGHTAQVESLAYSADGSFLASGSNDRTAKLWDLETELEITTFSGHTGQVDNIALSLDGTKLATASNDHTVRLWDIETAADTDIPKHDRFSVGQSVGAAN